MKVVRRVKNFSLVKRGRNYWVDNGQDVTEYMDVFDCNCLLNCSDAEFLKECKSYF